MEQKELIEAMKNIDDEIFALRTLVLFSVGMSGKENCKEASNLMLESSKSDKHNESTQQKFKELAETLKNISRAYPTPQTQHEPHEPDSSPEPTI